MSIKCENINEVIENTKKLIDNQLLKNEMIENQEKYIPRDTCEKIADIVIKELDIDRGNIQWKNIPLKKVES